MSLNPIRFAAIIKSPENQYIYTHIPEKSDYELNNTVYFKRFIIFSSKTYL